MGRCALSISTAGCVPVDLFLRVTHPPSSPKQLYNNNCGKGADPNRATLPTLDPSAYELYWQSTRVSHGQLIPQYPGRDDPCSH